MTMRSSPAGCAMPFVFAVILFGIAGNARAQVSRTFVSGFGDDTNPCTRVSPCKTLAAALAQASAGGEIDVMDPAGVASSVSATLTIDKAVSIVNVGAPAGVMVSAGSNAIVVNAGANDVVVLRGLILEGQGTALNGIKFIAGGALYVEDCAINRFAAAGIDFEPSGQSRLFVSNTVIRSNRSDPAGVGILFKPAAASSGVLRSVQLQHNATGVRVEDLGTVTVSDSSSVGNINDGFVAVSTALPALLTIAGSTASGNGNGVQAQGAFATVQISNVTVAGNTVGLVKSSGGRIVSSNNNSVRGNGTDGQPSSTIPQR